jgi:hypothetical protein
LRSKGVQIGKQDYLNGGQKAWSATDGGILR